MPMINAVLTLVSVTRMIMMMMAMAVPVLFFHIIAGRFYFRINPNDSAIALNAAAGLLFFAANARLLQCLQS